MLSCIVTQDLTLCLLQLHHADKLFAVVNQNREHLRVWLPWVDSSRSPRDTHEFIQSSLQRFAQSRGVDCGIWFNDSIVGCISFNTISNMNHQAEIGYWLSHSHQGKGIMTRACQRMIQYGFEELKLNRIVIKAAVENYSSRAIPGRSGFVQEGIERQGVWLYDRDLDSLPIEEWQS